MNIKFTANAQRSMEKIMITMSLKGRLPKGED